MSEIATAPCTIFGKPGAVTRLTCTADEIRKSVNCLLHFKDKQY